MGGLDRGWYLCCCQPVWKVWEGHRPLLRHLAIWTPRCRSFAPAACVLGPAAVSAIRDKAGPGGAGGGGEGCGGGGGKDYVGAVRTGTSKQSKQSAT